MFHLPPPDLNTLAAAPNGPAAPSTGRRLALAVAVAGTLGIGGAAVSSQLVSASAPVGDTTAPSTDLDLDETDTDETDTDETDTDETDIDEADIEEADIDWDAIDEAFEEYDSCLAEQLPEWFGDDAMVLDGDGFEDIEKFEGFEDIDMSDNISIYATGEDGEGEWTVLDLGAQDSSVSITKTDGAVEIVTTGDVEEVELADIEITPEDEAAWEAEMEQFDAAHETCADLVPDLGEFDDIEFIDNVFDDAKFGDGEFVEATEG